MTQTERNAYDARQWGVHISGPDTVLAARSFKEAVEQCGKINQTIVQHTSLTATNLMYPVVWAKVEIWRDIAGNAPHEPEKTNWDEVC